MCLTLYQSMKPPDDEKLMCMRVDTMSPSLDEHMHDFTKNDSLERCQLACFLKGNWTK